MTSRRFNRRPLRIPAGRRRSGPDTTIPVVQSAATNADGTRVILTYNEPLDPASGSNGTYTLANTASVISSIVSVAGNQVILATDTPILESDVGIAIDFTAGANTLKDLAGNVAENFSGLPVTNNVAPPEEELTLRIITAFADTSGNLPARTGDAIAHLWGGGGGGTMAVSSGGSGAYASVEWTHTVSEAYTITVGDGGAAAGGTGGDSTLNTNQCVAKGAAGVTGGASASCIGDVIRAGQNGELDAGNTTGASSPGSSTTFSSIIVPGTPDGGIGGLGNNNNSAKCPGGGARSTAGGNWAGARGLARLICEDFNSDTDYPPVSDVAITRTATADTSHELVMPVSEAGDTVVYIIAADGIPTVSLAGATSIGQAVSAESALALFYADGAAPPSTVGLTASEHMDAVVLVLAATDGAVSGTVAAQASSATPSSPSHDAGTSAPRVWITAMSRDEGGNNGFPTSCPAGFNDAIYVPEAFTNSGVELYVAWMIETTQIKAPGAWSTTVADVCVTATVGIER